MLDVAIVGLVLVALVALLNRPARFDARVDGDHLVVRLRGWDCLWCCRRTVRIPVAHVRGISVEARARIPLTGLRWPGTWLPGVITAGSFGAGPDRSFWNVRAGDYVTRIELHTGAAYSRIVLEPADPQALALTLRPQLGAWVPAH
jgi:hypothetical protein